MKTLLFAFVSSALVQFVVPKIQYGHPEHPILANVLWTDWRGDNSICIGIALNPEWVITLSYCMDIGYPKKQQVIIQNRIHVRLDDTPNRTYFGNGELFKIDKAVHHPLWNRNDSYDLVLIKLERKIEIHDLIHPIYLPPVCEYNQNALIYYYVAHQDWDKMQMQMLLRRDRFAIGLCDNIPDSAWGFNKQWCHIGRLGQPDDFDKFIIGAPIIKDYELHGLIHRKRKQYKRDVTYIFIPICNHVDWIISTIAKG